MRVPVGRPITCTPAMLYPNVCFLVITAIFFALTALMIYYGTRPAYKTFKLGAPGCKVTHNWVSAISAEICTKAWIGALKAISFLSKGEHLKCLTQLQRRNRKINCLQDHVSLMMT